MTPWRALLLLTLAPFLPGCGDDGGDGSGSSSGKTGPDPFDEAVLATYDITMPAAEWDAMTANLQDNTWRRCTVAWQGETFPDVAVHPAGQSSRQPEHRKKPSLWLSFKEFVPGREFHGYERVKLDAMADDPALLRERLAYPIYAARGVPAPRVMHCRVNVNGAYLGLYLLEERINKEFVTKRFGKGDTNQIYKWTERHPDVDYSAAWPASEFAQAEPLTGGDAPAMWGARIETAPVEEAAVQDLCRRVNEDPASAGAVFDVDAFINFMAVEVATGETDGYIGNNFHHPSEFYTGNIYLHKNPATGRFMLIVWDRDQSFWRGPRLPGEPGTYDDSITFGFNGRVLTKQLILRDPARVAQYRQVLAEVANQHTTPAGLTARLDAIIAQIRDAAFADTNRLLSPTNAQLQGEWDHELRPRFQRRYDDIQRQLSTP
jgi:spore coat protein CotH